MDGGVTPTQVSGVMPQCGQGSATGTVLVALTGSDANAPPTGGSAAGLVDVLA